MLQVLQLGECLICRSVVEYHDLKALRAVLCEGALYCRYDHIGAVPRRDNDAQSG